MPVTASDKDKWQPSLWSASLDKACSGMDDELRKLMIVSAGNLPENAGENYPDENHLLSIEDPAQAWNVVTVGGMLKQSVARRCDIAWLHSRR